MSHEKSDTGVLLVMSRDATTSTGPMSMWLLAAEWSLAAKRFYGKSWLLTPSGVLEPEAARRMAISSPKQGRPRARWKRAVPIFLGTLRADFRSWKQARRRAESALEGPWSEATIPWIWQYHTLFTESGLRAGMHYGSPVVIFVDAPVVWEAKQWGDGRPGWGWATQKWGELTQLKNADLVACVSNEVADQLAQLGVDRDRLVVTPNAVDLTRFNPDRARGDAVRRSLGIAADEIVIGWAGTFHSFHGLEMLLDAVATVAKRRPHVRLLLVGDGQQRPHITQRAADLGLREVLQTTGAVPHEEMPDHLAAMDICVLVDPGHSTFHYSPMKLQEYLACGRAVIAPNSGEMARSLTDGKEALLVPPGDTAELTSALIQLVDDDELRQSLGSAALAHSEASHTWDANIRLIHERLAMLPRKGRR